MADDNAIPTQSRLKVKVRDEFQCGVCGVHTHDGAWHHRRGRSVRDEHRHCTCNGVWLCHADHRKVHAKPFDSRALGLIVARGKMPFQEPVYLRQFGRWLLLDCEGTYSVVDAPA